MKKIIVGFAVFLNVLAVNANGITPISNKVLKSFEKEFTTASNINWVSWNEKNIFQATFTYNGTQIEAYFDAEGNLLSTARFIAERQLPVMVTKVLSTDYVQYKVRRAEEYSGYNALYYLVTVYNNRESVSLKFFSNGDVQRIKRIKNKI